MNSLGYSFLHGCLHTRALAHMALFALSLDSVAGLKYLHFKEVHICCTKQSPPLLTGSADSQARPDGSPVFVRCRCGSCC